MAVAALLIITGGIPSPPMALSPLREQIDKKVSCIKFNAIQIECSGREGGG